MKKTSPKPGPSYKRTKFPVIKKLNKRFYGQRLISSQLKRLRNAARGS